MKREAGAAVTPGNGSGNGENGWSAENASAQKLLDEMQATPNPTLEQTQQWVDRWIQSIGVRYFSELTNLAQLVEEVGELARILSRRFGEQSFKPGDKGQAVEDLGDEMADVFFVLVCLANQTGVDLSAALKQNLLKKCRRDATRHLENDKLRQ